MPPEIVLRTPNAMFVGKDIDVDIEVTAEAETRIDFIEAKVIATQGWEIHAGKNGPHHKVSEPTLVVRLAEAGVLPAGTSRYKARFAVPAGFPPSHDIDPGYAHVDMKVRVSIPWRFDARERFRLPVRIAPRQAVVARTPTIAVGRSGPAPDAPRIEIALASTRVIVGEVVAGSCAVFHLADHEPRPVDLTLVPNFTFKGQGRQREGRGETYRMTLVLPVGSAATAVPFEFTIPATAVPSFDATTHKLAWSLIASSGGFLTSKVSVAIPLELVDASAAKTAAALTVAPRLAEQRVAAVFAQVASRNGWRADVHADGDDDDGDGHADAHEPAIERDVRASRVRIAYRYRGEAGTFLVGRIEHPPLGLDLSVSRGSPLRHVFFADIEAGIAAWDRAYHVTARSGDQTAPVLRAVVPSLMKVSALGTLVRWDDDAMVFERAVTGVDPDKLESMANELITLVPAVETAAAAIAPPAGVTVDVAAWRELARWLRGTLSLGDLAIDGTLDELPVQLALAWSDDGDATGVRASVGSPAAAPAALRDLALVLARPWQDAITDAAAEPVLGALAMWPKDVVELRVVDGVATATWQLGADRVADPARVRTLVESLRALLAAFAPGAGPYR